MADELSEEAKANSLSKYLEASEKGLVDIVVEVLDKKPETLVGDGSKKIPFDKDWQQEETGHSALHKAALNGKLDVVKVLLEAGCDPNLDDANLQTCLHIAAKVYAEDTTGDFCFEDTIVALVEGGAMSLSDRDNNLPDVGEDAGTKVQTMIEEAEKKGKKERSAREKLRKEKGMNAFGNAMAKHLDNTAAFIGVKGSVNTNCTNQSGFSG
mmetsp:Transcript_10920/g.12849  ORF Transcript_10920/g.12849 Transcript_10920/m.12849 type:complete len:211 (-) Transcript_10920:283-915(-)